MSDWKFPTKPCHNCRRQRLKCDRSHPHCHKCIRAGQECMGYGEMFLWNKGVASRGKMMGITFEDLKRKKSNQLPAKANRVKKEADTTTLRPLNATDHITKSERDDVKFSQISQSAACTYKPALSSPSYSLFDPLFQDLDQVSRYYLQYFAIYVCKDLVCYDIPDHNPFRDLIPLTGGYPALFYIVTAISALHMSNASQRSKYKRIFISPDLKTRSNDEVRRSMTLSIRSTKEYSYALVAKQNALEFLRQILGATQPVDLEIVLASVLLFVEFELIDSGKDDWRFHISGAKRLINSLLSSSNTEKCNMSLMRSHLVSNCAVYDILGSTLTCSSLHQSPYLNSNQLSSALKSAEVNNYLSCPAILLQLVLTATEISHSITKNTTTIPATVSNTISQQISLLLLTARSFDAVAWATDLQKISPHKDAKKRLHIASAHKAAVCIYISRASSLFSQSVDLDDDLETMVAEVIHHLSFITSDDGLFKATSWPAFIAGAETKDMASQEWAIKRLYELWDFCPWGYIQSAVEILGMIREKRSNVIDSSNASMNWVQELRSVGVDWLIA